MCAYAAIVAGTDPASMMRVAGTLASTADDVNPSALAAQQA